MKKNIFGVMLFIIGLAIVLSGLIGAKTKLNSLCDIQDIFKESNRGGRFVYFDIKEEPKAVGEDGGQTFYLLRGKKYYHIAVMKKSEYDKIAAEVKQNGKARVTGVTKYLKDTDAEGEIAQSCEDMFRVGVIADNLYMFVGDVYIESVSVNTVKRMYLARVIWGGILVLIGVIVVVIRFPKKPKKNLQPTKAVERKSYVYKGEWAWDAVAAEYRRITGKSDDAELTEEENYKIYDYTMIPLSYFFGWLCERDLIGKEFSNEFGEEEAAKILEEIKNGSRTPLEVLADFDYYFTEDWIKQEARYFFRTYYVASNEWYTDSDVYLYDYYECNDRPDDRYYCIEYSSAVQLRLNSLIDDRYAALGGNNCNYSPDDFYSDDEDEDGYPIESVHSAFFNTDLDVERNGRIINGSFPEDYALRCIKCLDSMPQKEWHRLERWVKSTYGVEADEAKISRFRAFSISIFEPQYEGDLAFMINGGADYEEEHGISFTVRNGILLDWGYCMESGDPYDEKLMKRYEVFSNGIDFENITKQKELQSLVAEGKFIRTRILPDDLGGETTYGNAVFVTPEVLEHMQLIWKRLRMVRAYAASVFSGWEFHVDVKVDYYEVEDGTKVLVPMSITYFTQDTKPLKIYMSATIWE